MSAEIATPGHAELDCRHVLGMRVDATSYADSTARILCWAGRRESRYVCVANVHMVMEAFDSAEFRADVNRASLVTPDGMNLTWALRGLGVRGQQRVYGPELMLRVCAEAERAGVAVGLHGASTQALGRLAMKLRAWYPRLSLPYVYSPPFRPLSAAEDWAVVEAITASGARVLFVSLGCPRQERWMARHAGVVPAVMIGVGAAFDFHSGLKPQAPPLLQRLGLEWGFRLAHEPRRLFWRYARHNPRFVIRFAAQLAGWTGAARPI